MPTLFNDIADYLIHHPFLMIVAMFLPMWLVAVVRRAWPSRWLVGLVAVPAVLSLLVVIVPTVREIVLVLNLIVLGLAVFDLFFVVGKKHFDVERQTLRVASIGKTHEVKLLVRNRSRRNANLVVRDDIPPEIAVREDRFAHQVKANSYVEQVYSLRALERGRFFLERIYLRVSSLLGLWNSYYGYAETSEIHVYPDMKQLEEYALLARTNRLHQFGVRRTRRVGQDHEFERLRDYTVDDNYKFIDWRSSAKRQKLTVKDFQSSQSQRVIFLIDCGRMMTNRSGEFSLLDHSLNAMLMMSHVALSRGDSVGMICFSNRIHSYVPARGGLRQMNRLLHAVFDRKAEFVESRYDQAFYYLGTHCLKRSLVVLITNVIDEVNASQIRKHLGTVSGRHLSMGVLLRDHHLFDPVAGDLPEQEPFRAAAAAEIIHWRRQVINDLNRQGVLTVDFFPEQLTSGLVNRYLEIKARHLL